MTVVYVTEQGAEIGLKAERLVVTLGERQLSQVRLERLSQLVLMGHVSLTPPALRLLLKRRIDTVFLTRGGNYVGRLSRGASGDVELRHKQHVRFADPAFALELARRFVVAKLRNQRRTLLRAQRRNADERIGQAATRLRLACEAAEQAADLDALRGHEGDGAAAYFGAFGRLILVPDIKFERRIRRPPPDPVNILLSFGYTMLTPHAIGMLELAGFDAHLGTLHAIERGRPSLALDVIEEFRPLLVDPVVLAVINRRLIGLADFEEVEDGEVAEDDELDEADLPAETARPTRLVFRREGILKWVSAMQERWATALHYAPRREKMTYRAIFQAQVYRLARHVRGEEPYVGLEVEA